MSFVSVVPEVLSATAEALQDIGDHIVVSGGAADQVTAAVVAPGGDEVSEALAACLRAQAANYKGVSGRAAAAFDKFVESLDDAANAYSTAEGINAAHAAHGS